MKHPHIFPYLRKVPSHYYTKENVHYDSNFRQNLNGQPGARGEPFNAKEEKDGEEDVDVYEEDHLGPQICKEREGFFLVNELVDLSVLESNFYF